MKEGLFGVVSSNPSLLLNEKLQVDGYIKRFSLLRFDAVVVSISVVLPGVILPGILSAVSK